MTYNRLWSVIPRAQTQCVIVYDRTVRLKLAFRTTLSHLLETDASNAKMEACVGPKRVRSSDKIVNVSSGQADLESVESIILESARV